MTSQDQYRSLDSSKVIIRTIDSVLVLKPGSINEAWKRAYMPEVSLPWQKVKNDTIFYSSRQISIAVPFNCISFIKCRGVWDEEAGFISETEIERNFEGGFRIGFPIVGSFFITPASVYIAKYIAPKNAFKDVGYGSLILGFVGGFLLGHYFDMEIRYNEAIERAKAVRKLKKMNFFPLIF